MEDYKENSDKEERTTPAWLDVMDGKECALYIDKVHAITTNIVNASSFEEASQLFNELNESYFSLIRSLKSCKEDAKKYDLRDLFHSSIKIIYCDGIPFALLQHVIQCLCFLFDNGIVSSDIEPGEEIVERIISIIHSGFDSILTYAISADFLPTAIDLLGYIIIDTYVADIIQEMHGVFYRLPFNSKKSVLLFYLRVSTKYKECICVLQAKDIINDEIFFIKSCTIAIDPNEVTVEMLLCKLYIFISSNWEIDPIDDSDMQLMSWIDYVIKVCNIPIIWEFLVIIIERNPMIVYSIGTTFNDLNKLAIRNHDQYLYNYISYIIDNGLIDCLEFQRLFDYIITKYNFLKHYGSLYRFIVTYICKAESFDNYNIVFTTTLDENIFSILNDALEVYDFINKENENKLIRASVNMFPQFKKLNILSINIKDSFNSLVVTLFDMHDKTLPEEECDLYEALNTLIFETDDIYL